MRKYVKNRRLREIEKQSQREKAHWKTFVTKNLSKCVHIITMLLQPLIKSEATP